MTAAASTFADEVIEEGVEVYEFQPRMIHAKTMVIDDELSIVGTANMDNRSFRLNFEVIAAIYDRGVTTELAGLFERDLALSTLVRPRAPQRRLHSTAAGQRRPFVCAVALVPIRRPDQRYQTGQIPVEYQTNTSQIPAEHPPQPDRNPAGG